MLPVYILLLIATIVLRIFFRKAISKFKGKRGENKVARILSNLNENEYRVINDLYISTHNGNTYQIDHLIVSVYGLFVIETKNYSGWIFGNEKSENWTQIIYKRKTTFRNPIKQNWSHVIALKDVLEKYKNIPYFQIIVFLERGDLKDIESTIPVIYSSQLLSTVKEKSTSPRLTTEEASDIFMFLNSKNIQDKETKKKHIKNIKFSINAKNMKKANLICPKCNSGLVLRKGKYGKFYGCSNYPHCRFTMKY